MDIRDIDFLTFAGATLSTEERACLGPAITQRKLQEGLQEVLFWGRISGIERDYFIVYGFEPSKDYPKKKYYFWYVVHGLAHRLASPWPPFSALLRASVHVLA